MSRAKDGFSYSNIAATTAGKPLVGGQYGVSCIGTGFGTVDLQVLGPDGSTWVNVGASTNFAADGFASVFLPACTARIAVTTTTAVSVSVQRIMGE
jgi:hypothetical protein